MEWVLNFSMVLSMASARWLNYPAQMEVSPAPKGVGHANGCKLGVVPTSRVVFSAGSGESHPEFFML